MTQTNFLAGIVTALCFLADTMLLPSFANAQPDSQKIAKAMEIFKAATTKLGTPKLEPKEFVGPDDLSALYFGSTKINSNFDIVDKFKAKTKANATIFAKVGDDYVRVTTNVSMPGKIERAIGTNLTNQAVYALNKGEGISGILATILGDTYVVSYEPIKDSSGTVIGALQVSYKAPSPIDSTSPRSIVLTGYSQLSEKGKEVAGYGLYSYAIMPSASPRAVTLLSQIFGTIRTLDRTGDSPANVNIFYVPLLKDKNDEFAAAVKSAGTDARKLGESYSESFYDYGMANAMLINICKQPLTKMSEVCKSSLSRGPYIFTYAAPATMLDPVIPPYLFVDLSDIQPGAFVYFLNRFQEQVKREDFADGKQLNTLSGKLLNIALTASEWVPPVKRALADIIHTPSKDSGK